MAQTAFLFPDERAVRVGMGIDFAPLAQAAADVFELAEEATQLEVFHLCAQGPQDELAQVQNAQPCLVATQLAIAAVLADKGVSPDMAAGAGAGEYAAHALASTIDDERAIQLVARRGAMMAMRALLGERGEATALRNMELAFKGTIFIEPQIPLYAQATGKPLDVKQVNAALLDQFEGGARHWGQVVGGMLDAGAERFVICGPEDGSLRALVQSMAKERCADVEVLAIASVADLTAAGL